MTLQAPASDSSNHSREVRQTRQALDTIDEKKAEVRQAERRAQVEKAAAALTR